jgi:hypothetical protein
VKRAARRDKRTWAENLAQAAQKAAYLKNSRELYRITRQLARKSFTNNAPLVKGKDGKQIMAIEDQVQRWLEYFGEILSTPAQEVEHNLHTTPHLIPINENPPRHTEIFKVKNSLKRRQPDLMASHRRYLLHALTR